MTIKIPKGGTLLMIGDSITDCGRQGGGFLGHGYVALVDSLLAARHPGHPIRVLNRGVGGDTVQDLQRRWQADVLDLKPDWLSVMIGINDAWRQFGQPPQEQGAAHLGEFEAALDGLAGRSRPLLGGMVLMTPYLIEADRQDPVRARMDEHGQAVRRLAEKHQALFIDTQAVFDRWLSHRHPEPLSADRVHPSLTGHMLLAWAFLEAVGAEGPA